MPEENKINNEKEVAVSADTPEDALKGTQESISENASKDRLEDVSKDTPRGKTKRKTVAMGAPAKKSGKMVRKTPYVIAIVVLAILAVAGAGFGVAEMILKGQSDDRLTDMEATVGETKDEDESETEVVEEVADENETIAEERRGITAKDLLVRGDKLINKLADSGNYQVNYNLFSGDNDLSVRLISRGAGSILDCETQTKAKNDTYKLVVDVNYDEINKGYWFGKHYNESGYKEFEVTGIDASHVVDVVVGEFGQVSIDATILFLMDDGSLEYIPVKKALDEGFHSFGKVKGVSDVVRLDIVDIDGGCEGGGRNTIAQKANGEFYDLFRVFTDQGIFER